MSESIPHGGKLVNKMRLNLPIDFSRNYLEISNLELSDLELIANGAYSPLEGFMGKADYDSVVQNMRLSNGLPWSLPITLAVDQNKSDETEKGRNDQSYS